MKPNAPLLPSPAGGAVGVSGSMLPADGTVFACKRTLSPYRDTGERGGGEGACERTRHVQRSQGATSLSPNPSPACGRGESCDVCLMRMLYGALPLNYESMSGLLRCCCATLTTSQPSSRLICSGLGGGVRCAWRRCCHARTCSFVGISASRNAKSHRNGWLKYFGRTKATLEVSA